MRIVCLSAEAADICARLGAWDDVVAVSAFASQAGLSPRPVIGGFSTTDCDRVAALQPDLVLCFSDVQADIAAQLIRRGCTVLTTNQRTLAEIAEAIRLIGRAIDRAAAGEQLAADFQRALEGTAPSVPQATGQRGSDGALPSGSDSATHFGNSAKTVLQKPRVYFEEWPAPMISGIGWVGELIELCGGEDIFAARRGRASKDRAVQPEEVIAANPDILIASWCGKPVDAEAIRSRPGFSEIRAVQQGQIHALDSDLLLQPGPRILEGAQALRRILDTWRACVSAHPHTP